MMEIADNIRIGAISALDYSGADSLKFKAWGALTLIKKGMSEDSVYAFCDITPEEVRKHRRSWEEAKGVFQS
jgi:hypothetical protein